MRHVIRCFAMSALLLLSSRALRGQAAAPAPDPAPLLAAVQRLFDALGQRDTAAVRNLLVPGTRFVAMPGDTAPATARVQSEAEVLQSLAAGTERLLERIWAPVVQVRGPIATVWAPYDFHIEGRLSHCGIDTVTLLHTAAGWQIAGVVYTVQLQGCAPSPLGAPRTNEALRQTGELMYASPTARRLSRSPAAQLER